VVGDDQRRRLATGFPKRFAEKGKKAVASSLGSLILEITDRVPEERRHSRTPRSEGRFNGSSEREGDQQKTFEKKKGGRSSPTVQTKESRTREIRLMGLKETRKEKNIHHGGRVGSLGL